MARSSQASFVCDFCSEQEHLDARVVHSRDRLCQAFLGLLDTRPMGDISITAICKAAQLNRTTFYDNFLSFDRFRSFCAQRVCYSALVVCLDKAKASKDVQTRAGILISAYVDLLSARKARLTKAIKEDVSKSVFYTFFFMAETLFLEAFEVKDGAKETRDFYELTGGLALFLYDAFRVPEHADFINLKKNALGFLDGKLDMFAWKDLAFVPEP